MATLFRRSSAICQCQRSFSTSSLRAVSLQWDKNDPEALAEVVPAYPYGPTRWYKQSARGLYGGQRVQFGNNVSGPFDKKTRRTWHPNVFTRKLFSKALHRRVQVRVSARVLRTIDKLGGLDEYLLGEKPARVKELGESGWWLRWAIMQTSVVKRRFAEERIRLGLPAQTPEEAAEALLEATPEDAAEALSEATEVPESEGESAEEMEAVEMDDAFQIEQTPDLPVIKFRVGPGQHVMLTPHGWKRTRPSPEYFAGKRKEAITKKRYSNYVDENLAKFEGELDASQEQAARTAKEAGEVFTPITEIERARLLRAARRTFLNDMKQLVDDVDEVNQLVKAQRKEQRRIDKLQKLAEKENPTSPTKPTLVAEEVD